MKKMVSQKAINEYNALIREIKGNMEFLGWDVRKSNTPINDNENRNLINDMVRYGKGRIRYIKQDLEFGIINNDRAALETRAWEIAMDYLARRSDVMKEVYG